jgi:hypothetical protein
VNDILHLSLHFDVSYHLGARTTPHVLLYPHTTRYLAANRLGWLWARFRCTMTKRKKNIDYSSEEDSASDFELISVKRSVASRRKRRSATARKVFTDERTETSASNTYYVTPHPRSLHSISSPDLMRASLLEWYSGVHEVRGMPWRKPFDPSLDADARAQRAYEVSRPQHHNRELVYSVQRLC